jgi:hypothetical protein
MTYIKWECGCGKVFISNSNRRHDMDVCDTCGSFLDAEEYYLRCGGSYMFIKSFNYNFFDELVLCMKEQGLLEFVDANYLTLQEVMFIRELEDEMCEELK